jgi:hypothetical protein
MVELYPFTAMKQMERWFIAPPYPGNARSDMAMACINDNYFIFGGHYVDAAGMTFLNQKTMDDEEERKHRRHSAEAYYYNAGKMKWRRLPYMPFPVGGCRAVAYKNRYIIVLGGIRDYPVDHPYISDNPQTKPAMNFDVCVFDTWGQTWRVLKDNLPPFPAPDLAAIKANDDEVFKKQRKWFLGTSEPLYKLCVDGHYGRIYPALNIVNDKLYMAGGEVLSPNYNATDEMWLGEVEEDADTDD